MHGFHADVERATLANIDFRRHCRLQAQGRNAEGEADSPEFDGTTTG